MLQHSNCCIERGNHLAVSALRIVIPVRDRPSRLQFECRAGRLDDELEIAAGAQAAPKAQKRRETRADRCGDVEPAASKCALAPALFDRDQLASPGQHRDYRFLAFRLMTQKPSR